MRPVNPIGTAAMIANLLKRKWSATILRHFESGGGDPVDICKAQPELTPMALSDRLRMMYRYNLIVRDPFRASSKSLRYRLTPRGSQMLRMLSLIERLDEMNEKGEVFSETTIRGIVAPMWHERDAQHATEDHGGPRTSAAGTGATISASSR